MKDYQERVIIEQKELAEKIIKLTTFITDYNKYHNLSETDFKQLNSQLKVMIEYNLILSLRIRNFLR